VSNKDNIVPLRGGAFEEFNRAEEENRRASEPTRGVGEAQLKVGVNPNTADLVAAIA